VVFEGDREPVRGRTGQSGGCDQASERGGARFEGAEYDGGLVQDADSARVVHRTNSAVSDPETQGAQPE
jgi:hypothetical protein